MKERIEIYGMIFFKQQHWEISKELVVRDHPSEVRIFWTQVRDKWNNLKRHYHKGKHV